MEVNLDKLVKLLKEGNTREKKYAAQKLGELKYENALDYLIEALMDRELTVRKSAFKALESMEQPSVIQYMKKYRERLTLFFINELKNSYWPVRSFAARILGKIGEKKAVKPLIELLNDREGYVRYFSIEALGKLGELSALPYLIRCLIDNCGNIRTYVVDSIIYLLENFPDEPTPQELMILEDSLGKIKEYDNPSIEESSAHIKKLIREKKSKKSRDFVIIHDKYPDDKQFEIIEVNI
ncbi:MAG TPA: HEAT repeat domain-containing protein [Candidatus Eremiobacteraeota bacterium]|nr:MAG: PBS lyase HEAT-like repeat protein [bacterium ADurb.Bin363]HPZ08683.1 HEAT repeat domain-containing protein [Candidatus Eremiobacteraeota bacterium]